MGEEWIRFQSELREYTKCSMNAPYPPLSAKNGIQSLSDPSFAPG